MVRFQPVVGNSEIELELPTNEFPFLKLPITHVSNSWVMGDGYALLFKTPCTGL